MGRNKDVNGTRQRVREYAIGLEFALYKAINVNGSLYVPLPDQIGQFAKVVEAYILGE